MPPGTIIISSAAVPKNGLHGVVTLQDLKLMTYYSLQVLLKLRTWYYILYSIDCWALNRSSLEFKTLYIRHFFFSVRT